MKKWTIILGVFLLPAFGWGQTREIVKCRIWKTKSFCVLPVGVSVPENATYLVGASISRISCNELEKQTVVGVWVTFRDKNVNELRLKNNYSNITLIRKNTEEVLRPVAYMNLPKPAGKDEGNPQYLSSTSTFGGVCVYKLKPKEKYDLFILFEKAEVGDTLIIEDFLEIEVR